MRKDVKAGMGLALVAVIVAGWYYTRGDSADESIALGPQSSSLDENQSTPRATAAPAARPRATPGTSSAERRRTPAATERTRPAQSQELASATPAPRPAPPVAPRSELADASAAGSDDAAERDEEIRAPGAAGSNAPVAAALTGNTGNTGNAETLEPIEFYRIQPGDTLTRLAEVYYGKRSYADLIMRANPDIRDPDTLRAGLEIRLPAVPPADQTRLASAAPRTAPGSTPAGSTAPAKAMPTTSAPTAAKAASAESTTASAAGTAHTYVVKTGDSFYAIAQRELGSGGRWQEVFALNRELVGNDPKSLRPGMTLRLPPK